MLRDWSFQNRKRGTRKTRTREEKFGDNKEQPGGTDEGFKEGERRTGGDQESWGGKETKEFEVVKD